VSESSFAFVPGKKDLTRHSASVEKSSAASEFNLQPSRLFFALFQRRNPSEDLACAVLFGCAYCDSEQIRQDDVYIVMLIYGV
jgi:hypothetical protein